MVFFFQAEDGIRDGHVTGVQTCALPISNRPGTFIPIKRATSELAGSITTTNPVQSSLKMVCLQLGQTGPALIMRQVLQALSVSFSSPPSQPLPAWSPLSLSLMALLLDPLESTRFCLRMAV